MVENGYLGREERAYWTVKERISETEFPRSSAGLEGFEVKE